MFRTGNDPKLSCTDSCVVARASIEVKRLVANSDIITAGTVKTESSRAAGSILARHILKQRLKADRGVIRADLIREQGTQSDGRVRVASRIIAEGAGATRCVP